MAAVWDLSIVFLTNKGGDIICRVYFLLLFVSRCKEEQKNYMLTFFYLFLGAIVTETPANVEEGFNQAAPLVFHYGHKTPSANHGLYNHLISCVAKSINRRCDNVAKGG